MAMVGKSITVTSQQDQWLQSQVAKGIYASDSELFRDLIRERQVRETESAQQQVIRKGLIEAERALETKGYSDQSVKAIMEEVLERKGLDADLVELRQNGLGLVFVTVAAKAPPRAYWAFELPPSPATGSPLTGSIGRTKRISESVDCPGLWGALSF